jgi:class 3 adenylate cyclase
VQAAHALLAAVERLNTELAREGVPALIVGIGVASGPAVYGDLGSGDRKDFTALGDAVIIAARLQDLAKELGFPLLVTAQTLEAAAFDPDAGANFVPLGSQPLKGRSPVEVFGWPRAAGA